MKLSWKKVLGPALLAVVMFGVAAATLQARPASRGHFVLPYDVEWGTVSLPAGDYTFAIDHVTSSGTILLYRGTQAVGMVRSQVLDSDASQNKSSELLCVRHDGKVSVRALELPEVGTFYFALPKGMSTLVAKQPELMEAISVQVSGE
jgi:hypothetical protein